MSVTFISVNSGYAAPRAYAQSLLRFVTASDFIGMTNRVVRKNRFFSEQHY